MLVYRRSAVAVKYTSIFSYLNLSLSSVYVVCIHLEYYSSHFVLLITPLLLPFLTIPLPIFAWSSLLTYTLPSSSPNLLFLFLNLLPSPVCNLFLFLFNHSFWFPFNPTFLIFLLFLTLSLSFLFSLFYFIFVPFLLCFSFHFDH